ncbi:hypothetical protein DAMNIGENAA_11740 [Desulforhabdus amnigena]|jgi:hypothetical protein|uniref:Uncharacterized protein n=1 Tax=Desulforhabdus amnigena TaxID=40218 RepID=A0A9W6FTN6_9BACT|nr:hypothetical protein DAMNIGENAA_11740 [Desulforhabdus amnigena]
MPGETPVLVFKNTYIICKIEKASVLEAPAASHFLKIWPLRKIYTSRIKQIIFSRTSLNVKTE